MKEMLDQRGRTEAEAIAAYRAKDYPKPAMTADIALFSHDGNRLKVLLIRRGNHPFLGCWALPGGFASQNESILQTAFRELQEETGVVCDALQLVGVYSQPGRDPRGWIVSVAYTAYLEQKIDEIHGADDATEARWVDVQFEDGQPIVLLPDGEKMAFDHEVIVTEAIQKNAILASAKGILGWLHRENLKEDID